MLRLFKSLILVAFIIPWGCGESPVDTRCETNLDCFHDDSNIGYVCDVAESHTCKRPCTVATESIDCIASQYCDVPTDLTEGICRQDIP